MAKNPFQNADNPGIGWIIGFAIAAAIGMWLAYNPAYDENCGVVGGSTSSGLDEKDKRCNTPDADKDLGKGGNLDPRKKSERGSGR